MVTRSSNSDPFADLLGLDQSTRAALAVQAPHDRFKAVSMAALSSSLTKGEGVQPAISAETLIDVKPKELNLSQQIDAERRSVLREKIVALEEEIRDLQARLRYQDVLKEENMKQRAEIERLRPFEQSCAALQTELLCAKQTEQTALDGRVSSENELQKTRAQLEDDKRNLMYRLETAESDRLHEQTKLLTDLEKANQESTVLAETNFALNQEIKDLRETISRQVGELEAACDNRDAKLVRQKLDAVEYELGRTQAANKSLLAKNVSLQKGADGHGPKIHELKNQINALQNKLDKQFEVNKSLAIDLAGRSALVKDLQERLRAQSADELNALAEESAVLRLEPRGLDSGSHKQAQTRAHEILAQKLCDILSRSFDHHMPSISMSFDLLHRFLLEEGASLTDLGDLSSEELAEIKDMWEGFLKTQYQRLRAANKQIRETTYNL